MNPTSRTIRVSFEDGREVTCPARTTLQELLPPEPAPNGFPYIGALVDNDVTSLTYPLETDCQVRLLTMADPEGWPIYERSLAFLLAKAVKELFPAAVFSVEHAMGEGLYCSFDDDPTDQRLSGIDAARVEQIAARMRELVRADLPIERRKISFAEAVRRFREAGQTDKLNLLRFRNPPRIALYFCEGFYDLAHHPLVPRTGLLDRFALIHYPPGFVLQLPDPRHGGTVPPFTDRPYLFRIFQEHREWAAILGVRTVGQLNETIVRGDAGEFIRVAEALHEKKIARIADEISACGGAARLVLVSGPSASGKTTFAKRLSIQLRVNGLQVHTLSLDDYFLTPDQTPRNEAGEPDFEHLEALDLALFNEHLARLLAGEAVELPTYDFETKRREFRGRRLQLRPRSVLIIEGIHALNPRLTAAVPDAAKYRVYVSALTALNVDAHNRISTTDNRLLRRLVRDYRYRGHSAQTTLRMWPAVRRGEERWIFPFQPLAETAFNSALDYELAVLKLLAEPLLMQIKPTDAEYAEARRLTAFLLNFLSLPDREVPKTSVLREYIGGSAFRY